MNGNEVMVESTVKKTPQEISRELLSPREAQTKYTHKGIEVTVKSVFYGEASIEDLFFELIKRKLTNREQSVVYCENSQPAASVPLIGGN